MKQWSIFLAVMVSLAAVLATGGARAQEKFFLKADAGYSIPFIPNLSSELERQGRDGVDPGYGVTVSLGRTFSEARWAIELQFSVSFYPGFAYANDHEIFEGDLSHYSYAAILKRRLRSGSRAFIPSIGAGLGYSYTNLISGGGKIQALEGIALFQVESVIRDNISFLFETSYSRDLTEDEFNNPFLENLPEDVVKDSDGNPLEDSFSAIEIRAGIIVWLKPLTEE